MSFKSGIAPLTKNVEFTNTTSSMRAPYLGAAAEGEGTSKPDFAQTIVDAGNNVVHALQKAEATSIAGIKGDTSTYDVASSIMEAEQALRMAVAVRDKIINAYLEITRMQI